MSSPTPQKRISAPAFRARKGTEALALLTAYDYPTARLLDEAGVDAILVGDSVGTVIYGYESTVPVTVEDMVRHTQAVSRGTSRALVIADLPYLSYHVTLPDAVRNAGRLIQEGGAQAVKLEGGAEFAPTIQALLHAGIPVMGHLGLTPQTLHAQGAYRMHGKADQERAALLESAQALEAAGCFAVVLECVEPSLAAQITRTLTIPTIGIGSGTDCDGQILVTHDLVGLTAGRVPKFVKPEAQLHEPFTAAVKNYIERTRHVSRH